MNLSGIDRQPTLYAFSDTESKLDLNLSIRKCRAAVMNISDLRENDCKPIFVIVISGVLVAFATFIPMEQNAVAIITPYNSGYTHGCDDAKSGDHPYLSGPGHGATFHTGQFMQGYNDGFNSCGGNQGPPDSARSHHYNQGQLDCYYGRTVPGTHTPDYI
ncbi:MAG TPA: hypothetical protein VFD60_05755, partial [Nitrososphaeraceae archaeon]|nr:hypothetical protein [Nitrososphaeraceae archaeon]